MQGKKYLVTGGTGFIGRALVRGLIAQGHFVRTLDDDSRGNKALLNDIQYLDVVTGDIRDFKVVDKATKAIDCVVHLAYINGTQTFYERPIPILDIAVKGMLNVLEACMLNGVKELSLASSPEAYQTAPIVPTDETVALSVPDPLNPRYSYGGGKIICELMTLNYGKSHFEKVTVFRPHSIYGPKMGDAHVIPQLTARLRASPIEPDGKVKLQIQGSGQETRSFCYIDDCVEGILIVLDKGEHLNIYHIGTEEEVTISDLAVRIGKVNGLDVEVVPSALQWGSTIRRCPSINKLQALGYEPKVSLNDGLRRYVNG